MVEAQLREAAPSSESVAETFARLRAAQKSSRNAPLYSRYVNRPAGRLIASVAYRLGLTPNAVTLISAGWSLVAIAWIALGHQSIGVGIGAALCLAIGYAFDSADGQLARLQGGGSPVGEWLDHCVDCAKICALHLAVLVSFYRSGTHGWQLLVPALWTWAATVTFFGLILTDQIRRRTPRDPGKGTSSPSFARSVLTAPVDFGALLVTFAFFGWPDGFLVIYSVLLVAHVAFLLWCLRKWYGELSALGRPA